MKVLLGYNEGTLSLQWENFDGTIRVLW
jgi:hypothetical protein